MVVAGLGNGVLRYFGPSPRGRSANDIWLGIELDEAKGDSDGAIDSEHYFHCTANHGIFVELASNSVKVHTVQSCSRIVFNFGALFAIASNCLKSFYCSFSEGSINTTMNSR